MNGLTVLTLGQDEAAGKFPPHPFWGTERTAAFLKTCRGWPEVELPR